jgi:UDP-N-acetylenolpyruvoylglucosamine reductase
MDFAGEVRELPPGEMAVAYRVCDTLKNHIALGRRVSGPAGLAVEAIVQRMKAYSQKRWSSSRPRPAPAALFKNPPMIPAGKLIDELGLKGTRVGGARSSRRSTAIFWSTTARRRRAMFWS